MQKPAKNAKRLFPFALAWALMLMGMGCGEDDTQLNCKTTCDNEEIVEVLDNVKAKVIRFYDKGYILTINSDDIEREFFIHATNDYILVPCNLGDSLTNETIVKISGIKKNCCRLLTFPNERRAFGCKFEITSIDVLTEK